uniref:Putative secreted mucin n=1 Tax=Amblyomma parvum TaxID=251391 RepID=A0A023G0M2_AMBPA
MAKAPGISWLQLPVTVLLLINHVHPLLANRQECDEKPCVDTEGESHQAEEQDDYGKGSSSQSGIALAESVVSGVAGMAPQGPHETQRTLRTQEQPHSSASVSTAKDTSTSTGASSKSSTQPSASHHGSASKKSPAVASTSARKPAATPPKPAPLRVASSGPKTQSRARVRRGAVRKRRGR